VGFAPHFIEKKRNHPPDGGEALEFNQRFILSLLLGAKRLKVTIEIDLSNH
jgi:hypothetical protein